MNRTILVALFMAFAWSSVGQTKTEDANRAVFNKIEFFINTQMTDSIYNLAAAPYKEQVSADQVAFMLQNIYLLGRITDVAVDDFKGRTATYRLSFTEGSQLLAQFAVDSTYRYTQLDFKAVDTPDTTAEKSSIADKDSVISAVENRSALDFFVDSIANSYIKKGNTQSLAVAIFDANSYKTFLYGETAPGNDSLPNENTLYEIGAISKVFTATLLADLVTKGVIGLDDSITPYLPDSVAANPALQGITFKTLANHTSGLPRMAANWDKGATFDKNDPFASYDRPQLFAFLKQFTGSRTTGEEYEYSNIGYGLLGELIAIINEKPYMQCLQESIMKPLQLTHTTAKADLGKEEQGLFPGLDEDGNITPLWHWDSMVGSGGLKSNLRELMLFSLEQFEMPENDLQKAMAMTRVFTFFTPNNTDIGLAWHMSMLDGTIYFHHSGATAGSSSFIGISPDTKSVVIVLSNAARSVEGISTQIMEKLLSE